MARETKITKSDAAMIAIEHAEADGFAALGAPRVHSALHDDTWSVFVPDGTNLEPGEP